MQRTHGGFTLLEILVVMALIVVLAMVATPAMKVLIVKNRMVTEINSLTSAMNLARSEAIKRGRNVVVCKSASPSTCSPTGTSDCCTSAGDWTQGWLIFEDINADQAMVGTDGDEVIRIGDPLSGFTPLLGSGNAADWVSFNRYGTTPLNDTNVIKTCPTPVANVIYGRTFSVTGKVFNTASYACP